LVSESSNNNEFLNKVAIVSGGTSGMGRSIAHELARNGCHVVAFGIDKIEETSRMFEQENLQIDVLQGDVSSKQDIQRIVQYAVNKFGKINYLCNCAGIRPSGNILETSEDDWNLVLNVNLKGMFLLTKEALPAIIAQGGGAIVNIGSVSGFAGKNHFAYTVAKGAVYPFTRSLALDFAPHKVRVNAIIPGFIKTGMTEHWPEEYEEQVALRSVAGRVGLPQDVTDTAMFLLSQKAENITGTFINVGTLPGAVPQG